MSLLDVRTAVPIAREVLEGRPLQQLQEVAIKSSSALNAMALQPGVMLTYVFGGASTVTMSHGLGRLPRGWIVVDVGASATFFRASWDVGQLAITGSAACTAKVWVF